MSHTLRNVKMTLFITGSLLVILILAGCQLSRSGYESEPYSVKRTENDFEIRLYPKLMLVETPTLRAGDGRDGSFMRLFRYITGSNEQGQKIAMTTPVFMSETVSNPTMAFVLPKDYEASRVPEPKDSKVKIRAIEAGEFAVLRFQGSRSDELESQSLARLIDWVNNQHLKIIGSPLYAYFDPPWTPPFLRRNEVMLRLESSP